MPAAIGPILGLSSGRCLRKRALCGDCVWSGKERSIAVREEERTVRVCRGSCRLEFTTCQRLSRESAKPVASLIRDTIVRRGANEAMFLGGCVLHMHTALELCWARLESSPEGRPKPSSSGLDMSDMMAYRQISFRLSVSYPPVIAARFRTKATRYSFLCESAHTQTPKGAPARLAERDARYGRHCSLVPASRGPTPSDEKQEKCM